MATDDTVPPRDDKEQGRSESAILPPGTRMLGGEYEVVAHLGSGAFADVYHVIAPAMGEGAHFALKVIRPDASRGVGREVVADYEERFKIEAELAARIHDPHKAWPGREHVIQVYRVGRDEATGAQCAVMELAAGGSLADRLASDGPMPVSDALPLFIGMLRGLSAVHGVNAIHRDIKPANILLATADVPKIADLGLAQVTTDHRGTSVSQRSVTGSVGALHPGTPEYMSPEHGRPQALFPTSDIYSLGAVFFEILTGEMWQKGRVHWSGPREALAELRAERESVGPDRPVRDAVDQALNTVPRWLDEVIQRMLLPTPGESARQREDANVRWVLATDVLAAFERGALGESVKKSAERAPKTRESQIAQPWFSAVMRVVDVLRSEFRRAAPATRVALVAVTAGMVFASSRLYTDRPGSIPVDSAGTPTAEGAAAPPGIAGFAPTSPGSLAALVAERSTDSATEILTDTAIAVTTITATAVPTNTSTTAPTATSVPTIRPSSTPMPTRTLAPTRAPSATPRPTRTRIPTRRPPSTPRPTPMPAAPAGWIAFTVGAEGFWSIHVTNPATGSTSPLDGLPHNSGVAAWAPNGQSLAFRSNVDGNWHVYTIDRDGTNLRQLTFGQANNLEAAWSPAGTEIAFVSDRDGNYEIYLMYADGSDQRRLTNNPGVDDDPTWSSDGASLAFESSRGGRMDVYRMRKDGSSLVRLTDAGELNSTPAWSRDGRFIAFERREGRTYSIWTMDADGSNQRKVTSGAGSHLRPAWSPDGSRIAFTMDSGGSKSVWTVDVSNGTMTQASPGNGFDAAWSR